ncbi:MAG TPA: hypothetical protein VKT31_13935, partial [Solirubrobacteraceae bacterium]|nr:hypothetical protein [Solirubrobacteraceae bacterium]
MGAARFVCRLQLAAGLSLLGLLSFGSSAPAQARRAVTPAGRVTEFTAGLRSAYGSPQYIARGRDGNLWFTTATSAFATVGGAIGRITPKGRITEFSTGAGTPSGIAAGADGNIWFTTAAAIGRMTPKGDITYFPLTESLGQAALGIALGSDRNMWFTVTGCQHLVQDCWIGRITPTGQITEFSAGMHSSQSAPYDIALGPDGNMWFTDNGCVGNGPCAIGRITPRGEITEFGAIESGDEPVFIAPGPDRAMWFTESAANGGPPGVGRITTTGKASFFYTYQAAG